MFKDKKIFVFGMAKSGYEVAKLLSKETKNIYIFDSKEQDLNHVKELENLGVTVTICQNPEDFLDETFDYVVKNPGIIKTHPCVVKAKKQNIPVINEVEVAYDMLPKDITIIGVTGSNGKTTTTTMIYEVMKKASLPVLLGGNIGYPVSSLVEKAKKNDILVLEISDHQLVDTANFKTNISVLTNISEAHLDFHGDYLTYKNVKKKIFNNHTKCDIAIINLENSESMEITKDIMSTKEYFSKYKETDCYIKNDKIYYQNEEIIPLDQVKIKGVHNYENIMCMIMVVKKFGVTNEVIKSYLSTFKGVEHRIEYVDDINGITFYNDSKATNTESTIIALDSFQKPTILLLGGLDRGHSFEPLIPSLKNVKLIISYGETKQRIKLFADTQNILCIVKDNLKDSVYEAYQKAKEGDVILFSPACASWDQFDNFEIRGKEFKDIVKKIKEGVNI